MISIINAKNIDREYDEKHNGVSYYWIRYIDCSFLVGKEYPAYSIEDAIDSFADWQVDNALGLGAEESYLEELRSDATKDEKDSEEYVDEYYMRAGNDSHYIRMPEVVEFITEKELIEKGHALLENEEGFVEGFNY